MSKILQLLKIKELRDRLFAVLCLLILFRFFSAIPIPGIDADRLRAFFASNQLFGFLSVFSGGALSNLSIVMLGVSPYITAVITMQLLTMIFPKLKEMYYEEGSIGRAKFNRYSRYLTVPLAVLSGFGFLKLLASQGILPELTPLQLFTNVAVITAGSVILMWMGEIITEQKLGNGISLIIFAGIVGGIPLALRNIAISYTPAMLPSYLAFLAVGLLVIAGVVFIEQGERKIAVAYAKRVRGTKLYGGTASYLPIKVNKAGVIPIIFAISLMLFPQFFSQILAAFSPDLAIRVSGVVNRLFDDQLFYGAMYFFLVFLFTYFYTAVTFDPNEISKNLQRAGGFVPGIRPGSATSEYVGKIVSRITLWGAIFLGLIAVLPNIVKAFTGIASLALGGTALLIVVAVALEIAREVNAQLLVREYEGF